MWAEYVSKVVKHLKHKSKKPKNEGAYSVLYVVQECEAAFEVWKTVNSASNIMFCLHPSTKVFTLCKLLIKQGLIWRRKEYFHMGLVKDSISQQEGVGTEKKAEDGFEWNLCWLLAQRETVKIRLSGENTGDGCVLRLGTADGLTLLRLQRTQDWMCICAPKQWDWTPQSRRSLSRTQMDRIEAKKRPKNTDSFVFFVTSVLWWLYLFWKFISKQSFKMN